MGRYLNGLHRAEQKVVTKKVFVNHGLVFIFLEMALAWPI